MSKHLFSLNDILPDRTLDGEFAAYSVFTHVPDHSTALILLRTLASIVASLMTRHGLEIDLLEESYASNRELGRNLFTAEYDPDNKTHNPYRSHTVQIRLRHETVPDMYLSLGELPCTLCHELAHCWYLEHEQVFYMKWIELMNEVTQDLEDSVIIDWGCGPDEQMLRCFRVDPGLRLDNGDRKAMAAAKDWVNFYWEFLCEQGQPADRRKRELKLPERKLCCTLFERYAC
jgi:hypothetical protein